LGNLASAIAVRAEEASIIAELKSGSEDAYSWLITHYHQPIYSLVYRILSDPADAADTTQEVFLKVFRSIGSFRGNSALKTWIYRIAVNESYNHRRWFSRHQRQEIGMERPDGIRSYEDSLADQGRSPFQLAADRETRALVEGALARVNPNFRAAVVLRDIEDMSYEEIAAILEISLGTVKSRILRGREALRKVLTSRTESEPAFQFSPQTVE